MIQKKIFVSLMAGLPDSQLDIETCADTLAQLAQYRQILHCFTSLSLIHPFSRLPGRDLESRRDPHRHGITREQTPCRDSRWGKCTLCPGHTGRVQALLSPISFIILMLYSGELQAAILQANPIFSLAMGLSSDDLTVREACERALKVISGHGNFRVLHYIATLTC